MLGLSRGPGLHSWAEWEAQRGNWIMGGLPYEWKSHLDQRLESANPPEISWPELAGFVPELLLLRLRGSDRLWVIKEEIEEWEAEIESQAPANEELVSPVFHSNFSRDGYLQTVEKLRQHIKEGDCYEINLAQTFTAHAKINHPELLFLRLIGISPVPFAAYLKCGERHLISASPERFLQHRKRTLLTQPIKGTARRGSTAQEDQRMIETLLHSEKERAENVMIVDLSRHDLNQFCRPFSVQVPSLFHIQSFPQVHQLVSTVRGELAEGVSATTALSGIFPPGSMTGAPKHKVMQLIDQYEPTGRGLYAGAVGYISPGGDFDFNVVIRSLMYAEEKEMLSYHVGGAITYDSDAEREYEETLLKASAIRKALGAEA